MYDKLFEKYFSFLLQHGFQMKLYSRNSETEALYQSASAQIEVCIDSGFFKVHMDVIISNGEQRSNLFQYTRIDFTERERVRLQVGAMKKIDQKFAVYSSFIARHLDSILLP